MQVTEKQINNLKDYFNAINFNEIQKNLQESIDICNNIQVQFSKEVNKNAVKVYNLLEQF